MEVASSNLVIRSTSRAPSHREGAFVVLDSVVPASVVPAVRRPCGQACGAAGDPPAAPTGHFSSAMPSWPSRTRAVMRETVRKYFFMYPPCIISCVNRSSNGTPEATTGTSLS